MSFPPVFHGMIHSRRLKGAILLLISYVFLYLFYAVMDFLPKWDGYGPAILSGKPLSGYLFVDPLFLFIPLIGFVFMWLSLSWYLRHFRDSQVLSVVFPLSFVLISYAAFFVALLGFYWNNAFLSALVRGQANPGWVSFGPAFSFVATNFLDMLIQSPFFLFVISGLLGWVSYVFVHTFWKEKFPHLS